MHRENGMRFAIVNRETGKVVNVILWEGAEFIPPRGHIVVRLDECDIDDTYDFNTNKIVRLNRTAKDSLSQ